MTKMKPTVADRIRHLGTCTSATTWAAGYTDPAKAWRECQRGDWMLWLLGTQSWPPKGKGRKKLVLAACECARLALPHTKDQRVLVCIETAERWARGEAAIGQLCEARAYAAAAAAAAAYAAAAEAAEAAVAAVAAVARSQTLATCADIVRKHYPEPPRIHP